MAGYNNYYPAFQPMYPYAAAPQQPQPQPQGSNLNWVQGEAGAKSFLVAPNTTVLLMDSEESKFYLKGADESGMPKPLRIFEYTEITNRHKEEPRQSFAQASDYVTKKEFEEFKEAMLNRQRGERK